MNQLGRYLDVYEGKSKNNTNVVVWRKNGTPAQIWKPVKTDLQYEKIAEGYYTISPRVDKDNGLALDVAANGVADGTNIQIYQKNNSIAQIFEIRSTSEGWYRISNPFSESCLDVQDASNKNGTNVQLHRANGSQAQEWRFYRSGDGDYIIKNRLRGKYNEDLCLDVYEGKAKNGANVIIWQQNGTNAQKWKIDETKIIGLKSIQINPESFTLKQGSKKSLSVIYGPSNASAAGTAVRWETSNSNVAQVSNGVVEAVAPGRATIIATAYNGKISKSMVTVKGEGDGGNLSVSFQMPLNNARCTWRSYTDRSWGNNNGSRGKRAYHLRVDIIGSDDDVHAAASGKVVSAGWNNANGNYVVLQHDLNGQTVYSFYAHLSGRTVSNGASVNKGAKIGVVGNTGSASMGKHLHFSMMDKHWKGSYYGHATYFSGNKATYCGVTYYNPIYVINNGRLP